MASSLPNLFRLPPHLPQEEEFFEVLASGPGLKVERIISQGHSTPSGQWYDQNEDEWVVLLQGTARLEWEDGTSTVLNAGDWLLIPAHRRHRVATTTTAPPCVWLAIHASLSDCGAPHS